MGGQGGGGGATSLENSCSKSYKKILKKGHTKIIVYSNMTFFGKVKEQKGEE